MQNTSLALSAALLAGALALPTVAQADVAFNVGATTDYRYRGISQSRLDPAVFGGIDWSGGGGFYVGAWASSIKWINDVPGGDSSVEIDLYGGYKGEITKEWTYDVGVLTYQYPSNKLNPSANTTELYGALTYGPFTVKYSHAVTDTFGNLDSKNSSYFDLSGTFEITDGWMATPHIGYQNIKGPNSGPASYADYSFTVSKDFSGFLVSAMVVATDADKAFYVPGANANSTEFLGKSAFVLSVKYSF